MQQIEDEVAPSVEDGEFDAYEEAIQEIEAAVQSNTETPSNGHAKAATITPRQREASEELGDPGMGFDDDETEPDPERELTALPMPQNQANSRKKRKSDAIEHEEAESPRPAKIPKKRGRPRVHRDMPLTPSSPKPMSAKAKGKQPLRDKNPNLKLSSRQEKELQDIVEKVKARPGPPRSLYILRRETPADDAVTHTRSGRVSVKPLAYWRNERCVFGSSPRGANLADGARFPLNSIKEIVRTEEVAESLDKKKSRGKKKGGKKAKGKARQTSAEEEDTSDSDFDLDDVPENPDAEPWENESGTLRGNVSIWDNAEQAPTEQEEEVEIAHAPAAIKTREVKGSGLHDGPTFRYAKLLSTKFFGTGLVDLPPGGVKRPKNSRKMHMSFFVVKGRVTVTVGPVGGEDSGSMNRFSIGKGGFWQVPRGKSSSLRRPRKHAQGTNSYDRQPIFH
jgi:centromere protein C